MAARCSRRALVREEALPCTGHIRHLVAIMGHVDFHSRCEINRISRQDARDGFCHLLIRQRVIGRDEYMQRACFNPSCQRSSLLVGRCVQQRTLVRQHRFNESTMVHCIVHPGGLRASARQKIQGEHLPVIDCWPQPTNIFPLVRRMKEVAICVVRPSYDDFIVNGLLEFGEKLVWSRVALARAAASR
jgi:hypothetical protein